MYTHINEFIFIINKIYLYKYTIFYIYIPYYLCRGFAGCPLLKKRLGEERVNPKLGKINLNLT